MAQVMISINVRTMGETAKFLKDFFEQRGVSCWICTQMSGGIDFREAIVEAVKKCQIFIPLINAEWAGSGECKDEFNYAKRLNLTSHESGRSIEGDNRLPVILPIAFPNLIWDQYPHVELLASSTNFIVHKQSAIVTLDSHSVTALNDLVRSINLLKLKGMKTLSTLQMDESGVAKDVSNGAISTASLDVVVEDDLPNDIKEISVKLHHLLKDLQTLQTKAATPHASTPSAIKAGDTAKGSLVSPISPPSGWTNNHVRDRYLGMSTEYSWSGARLTWAIDCVIEKKDTSVTPMSVSGYMRWRMINAVPFKKDYNIERMAGYTTKITEGYEADEVFNGTFDAESGTLQTTTHDLRAVPNNPAVPKDFIGPCIYTFVMTHDGKEMIGRCVLTSATTITQEKFMKASVLRCVAY